MKALENLKALLFSSLTALIAFSALTAVSAANADLILPPSKIIVPDPSSYSEMTSFEAQWCSDTKQPASVVRACYGRALFQNLNSVRAVAVSSDGKNAEIYVESQWPAVELLKLEFEILGPVNGAKLFENGQVALEIDAEGEVIAVRGQTPRHGFFSVSKY
jgi:hypothetical protein